MIVFEWEGFVSESFWKDKSLSRREINLTKTLAPLLNLNILIYRYDFKMDCPRKKGHGNKNRTGRYKVN